MTIRPMTRGEARMQLPKPHIDDVAMAFHKFHADAVMAMTRYSTGSKEQSQAFDVARDKLRLAMTELGLAQHIDWTPAI